ncbi:MAG: hypothetical protein WEB00_05680 [Dehalococcoidia bacterium]
MTRITRALPIWLLIVTLGLSLIALSACGGDDDDDATEEENATNEEGVDPEEEAAEPDEPTDPLAGEVNNSPATGAEYIQSYSTLASQLLEEHPNCQGSVDFTELNPETLQVPPECQDYYQAFADGIREIQPPASCEDLHQLLLDTVEAVAAGDQGALSDLFSSSEEGTQILIDASVACSTG